MQATMTSQAAVRDGVRLNYIDAGSGDPALLFVHGFCGQSQLWNAQLSEFGSTNRVVAVDLRGHGQSDKPQQAYTVAAFADDVAWLGEHFGLDRPVLIGHSMGGSIVLEVLRTRPKFARAAVFVDAPLGPLAEDLRPLIMEIYDGLQSEKFRDVAVHFHNLLFREDTDHTVKEQVQSGIAVVPQRTMTTAFKSVLGTLPKDDSSYVPLPVPTIYVRAETQPVTEDQLQRRFPDMKVITVDAAHFLHMEKPQQFNGILREFLESIK